MKKILSLLMALVMLLSCFSAFSVSAEEGGNLSDMLYTEDTITAASSALKNFYVSGLPDRFDGSFAEFKNSSYWNSVNLLGMDLDFLYSDDSPLIWGMLDVYVKDAEGNVIPGPEGAPVARITPDDISQAMTNIGIYLQRVVYSLYGGLNLYTVENAIALSNFIGKMFYPDFAVLNPANFVGIFGNATPSAVQFYKAVATLSGFDKIIGQNWVPRGKGYCESVVTVLGGSYVSFPSDYYNDPLLLSSKLLEAIVNKFVAVGPIDYIYDFITSFSSYTQTYYEPFISLFSLKSSSFGGNITDEEKYTFNGLLKLMLCDCNNGTQPCVAESGLGNHFCAFEFPTERFNSTSDKNERLIYLFYYFNLAGRYKGNREYIQSIEGKVRNNLKLSVVDMDKICALINGFFLNEFPVAVDVAVVPLYKENISTATTSIFDRMKNSLMIFLKKIADYFEYLRKIFSGYLEYGQGNSPFN